MVFLLTILNNGIDPDAIENSLIPTRIWPFIVQLLSTFVFLLIVKKFLYLPIKGIIDKRADFVKKTVDDANEKEKQASLLKTSLEEETKKVQQSIKRLREEMRDLISVRTNLDNHTAEGQADNARFNYLISSCLVYSSNKEKYFKSYEDYLSRASEPVAIKAAQVLANMLYGLDNDYEKKLPENKFLVKYKFVDEKLRLINKDGHLVDLEGRLVDSNGRYVNDKGEYVDKNGVPVDINGDYITDFKPFTDDDGNPVVLSEDTKENIEKENDITKPEENVEKEESKKEE
jgi:hypothetical protein